MKRIKLITAFAILFSICSCSTSKLPVPTFGKKSSVERRGNDIIFDKDYMVGIELTNIKDRFTPSFDEIDSIKILVRNKNIWNSLFPEKSSINQYFGFIDKSDRKFIVVQIVNNKNPKKVNRLLGSNWEYDFVLMLSDEFYSISNRFKIDIENKSLYTKF